VNDREAVNYSLTAATLHIDARVVSAALATMGNAGR